MLDGRLEGGDGGEKPLKLAFEGGDLSRGQFIYLLVQPLDLGVIFITAGSEQGRSR